MRLIPIDETKYADYRLELMLDGYKWDPQFADHNTVSGYALVLTEEEHKELVTLTESLDRETRQAEELLNKKQYLTKPLKLTKQLARYINRMGNYDPSGHIRLTRYDFHPVDMSEHIKNGVMIGDKKNTHWAISEVNSDVPGGFAEATLMPVFAMKYLENANKEAFYSVSFGDSLVDALKKRVKAGGTVMLVHCTSYSDDRQVMQFLGDRLAYEGYKIIYGAGEHVNFKANRAYSVLDGNEGNIDAIFRFTPLEWIGDIKPRKWHGYFDTLTVSCNHPVAIYAQTKRFPMVWDSLEKNGVDLSTWRSLLPDTIEVKNVRGKNGYIYKPAYGRVGEGIAIKEACTKEEYKKILKDVRLHPSRFLAQKRFNSKPVYGASGEKKHVCIGAYAVDGRAAGYYARISDTPRIDSNAADIPVLIERDGE